MSGVQLLVGVLLLATGVYMVVRRDHIARRLRARAAQQQPGAVPPAMAWLVLGSLDALAGLVLIAVALT